MKRTRRFVWCAALLVPLLGVPEAYAGDLVPTGQTPLKVNAASSASAAQKSAGHSRYVDGTGDMLVDKLNASQLNQNYKGPVYYPGQPIPPFQPIDTKRLLHPEAGHGKNTGSPSSR
ncbi:hypothetical protein [Acetobacter orleanensis]|uniref:Uncharacterized protein n=1 Tax=Acetobacter orleanensis TaxID=104099 RepID=A0A4Y3TS96_9PROT|nr:hypothetical protein [Acetobacter orleanensis]PCD78400.1 hypothetical protein CO710_12465 [Acetobacter orleanensis]GAN69335.1 hypothetical protein Abol_031_009 [Acetobacter orleanensis JCM 7639]GEB83957.1 hypothetical protein AOR01nite_24340 [Acetobacter orleanensis]